jgi:predicted DNA-binding WGR domain protein
MEKTIEVKGHTANVGGKTIWIPASHRHIEIDVDEEFGKTVANLVKQHVPIPEAKPAHDPVADLDADFDKFVTEMKAKGQLAEPPAAPKPPKEVKQVISWPQPKDVDQVFVLHNTDPGHDKVYKISVVKVPDGKWAVIGQWGKVGAHMAQMVKGQSFPTYAAAETEALALAAEKKKKGYHAANPALAMNAKAIPIEQYQHVVEGPPGPGPYVGPAPVIHPKIGDGVKFQDLKPGMQFKDSSNNLYTVNYLEDDLVHYTAQAPGKEATESATNKDTWNLPSLQLGVTYTGMGTPHPGPKEGDTKVENGVTYVLNANHRWELASEQGTQAGLFASQAAKPADKFPFKQVGPQGGAQPGGQFVDEFGQKWYIKFPQSEDHCKNEVLALKFYRLILGKDAVPQVKMVKAKGLGAMAKDGQLGIASKWVEGISKDPEFLAKGAPGVFGGFGADAWLANWDVAGSNQSQYLNLLKTKEGGSIRVDAGGALIHTGLGALKSPTQFGDVVTEIDRLRDPAVNKETAHIFKAMTQEQMIRSVVRVLEVPDDIIQKTVEKWGPGTEAEKKALAAKLIARKKYLAKRFPEADLIANPPAPDKHHLQVDPSKLPPMLDYFKIGKQGATGTWVSQSEAVNKANNAAAQSIYDLALKGDYLAFSDLKAPVVDKNTGEVQKMVPIAEHPSAAFLVPFYNQIKEHLEVLAYPAAAKAKAWVVEDDVEDIQGLSDAFPAHQFVVTVADVPANERLGFWIQLGKVDQPERFMPTQVKDVTSAQKATAKTDYTKFSSTLKSWLSDVQGSGSYNIGDKKSHVAAHKQTAEEAYKKASEFAEGSHLRRWLVMPEAMIQQFVQADPGLVFENPRSQCCSTNPNWESSGSGFGGGPHGVFLDLVYAKGAKGMATFASGSFSSEQEITSLPGQRYMLMSKGKASNGKMRLTLLVLPPDPTYVDAFKKVA